MASVDKRGSLLKAADRLFHHNGFEHTSLADIAVEAGVPLGNVYYYFKTRNDLVKAVSKERRRIMRERREDWERRFESPRDRLLAYVDSFAAREEEFTAHGCPVGGLCLETSKLGGEAAADAAAVFRDSLDWIEAQFRGMGIPKGQAQENAARLVGARQGSVLLAAAFQDPKFIRQELARLRTWLADMPAGKKGKQS